jgi:phosphatidylinositol-4-phosphate 3-kinase
MATKFNFFIHNLAQLRFSGLPASDEPILSFSPRTYSLKQDGRVMQASIFSFQKRYSPDKHYVSQAGYWDYLPHDLWSGEKWCDLSEIPPIRSALEIEERANWIIFSDCT